MTKPSSKLGRSGMGGSCSMLCCKRGSRVLRGARHFAWRTGIRRKICAAIERTRCRGLAVQASAGAARSLLQVLEAAVRWMHREQVLAGFEDPVAEAFERLPQLLFR